MKTKLTKEQAVIISGFTGILCGEFSDLHADVEKRLGRGVQTFEFGIKGFIAEVKKLYEDDFIEIATIDSKKSCADFALVSKDKLHEWKCMARRSEELGCPDCYESRGYSHNLAEEIEAQEQNQ